MTMFGYGNLGTEKWEELWFISWDYSIALSVETYRKCCMSDQLIKYQMRVKIEKYFHSHSKIFSYTIKL